LGNQAVEEFPALFDVDRLVEISAGRQSALRMNQDVDVFGEAVDKLISFGQRGAALELETKTELLQALQGMHDPVVLLGQTGNNLHVCGDDRDQIADIPEVV
jgi:hypothetical protein